jgi:hypothetical protein
MTAFLKILFWLSIFLAILASGLLSRPGGFVEWYLVVAGFALPGIFIKSRLYSLASLFIFCAWLAFAVQDYYAGKRFELYIEQLKERIQTREEKSR